MTTVDDRETTVGSINTTCNQQERTYNLIQLKYDFVCVERNVEPHSH
jgi:hypothetical protein